MDENEAPPPRVVSRRAAVADGISDGAIAHRVRTGRWQRLYPGTFAPFSGPVPREVWFDAAVQYAGEGAALSHQTAAFVQGWRPDSGIIHVTVAARRTVAPQKDVHIHRSRNWSTSDVVSAAVPRTTADRTLLDLVVMSSSGKVAGLVTDAIRSRLTTPEQVLTAAAFRPVLRHRRLLVEVVVEAAGGVESVLELEFAKVLRSHGLVEPRRQVREVLPDGRAIRLDTLFDPYDVVAELDGRLGHSTAADRERDRQRDDAHRARGRNPLRFGWARVLGHGCAVAAEVATALRDGGWQGQPHPCGPLCELSLAQSFTDEAYRREA
jgi:hypothetical protein